MANIIAISCYRASSNWPQMTSEQLAAAITAPAALQPLTLTGAFYAAVQIGADLGNLSKAYSVMNNEYVVNLRDALHDGDINQVQILIQIGAAQLGWTAADLTAINTILAANTLLMVDKVAAELGEVAPETVTAADVDAALGR